MEAEFDNPAMVSRDAAQSPQPQTLRIEVSTGELIDKITILRIKSRRIRDPVKLEHVRTELEALTTVRRVRLPTAPALENIEAELECINGKLWEVEAQLRRCEANSEFGADFVQLARSVYKLNDRRSELKRAVNALVPSRIVEEKSY